MLFREGDQVPMGGLDHQHDGACCVHSFPSIRYECSFIAHVLLLLTYVLAYLPCDIPLIVMCLVESWFVMWLPLVGYAYFMFARYYVVTPLHRDACGVSNQWVCSYRLEFQVDLLTPCASKCHMFRPLRVKEVARDTKHMRHYVLVI